MRLCLSLGIAALLATPFQADAKVEWRIENTLKTEQPPLDVTVSPNGQSIFVLTTGGNILIYDSDGQLKDTINVGAHIDQIQVGPGGEQLFATSRKKSDSGSHCAEFYPQNQSGGLTIERSCGCTGHAYGVQ